MDRRKKTIVPTSRSTSNASAFSDLSSSTMVASPRSSLDESNLALRKLNEGQWKAKDQWTGSTDSLDSQEQVGSRPAESKSADFAIRLPKRALMSHPRTSSLQDSDMAATKSPGNQQNATRSSSMPSRKNASRSYHVSRQITKGLPDVPRLTEEMRHQYATQPLDPPRPILCRTPTGTASVSSSSLHTANSSTSTLVEDVTQPRTRELTRGKKAQPRTRLNFSKSPGPPPSEELPRVPCAFQSIPADRRLARVYTSTE